MSQDATFQTFAIVGTCCEDGCDAPSTVFALGIVWESQAIEIWEFCREHADAAVGRILTEKANDEGLN